MEVRARKRVAVIGAGPSGLAAARHLSDTNNEFQVFERTDHVGGTWKISEYIGKDQYGLPVHSSMYKNLRTNLPKEIMLYPDFPIPELKDSFIGHKDVLNYIEKYVEHFNLRRFIHFHHLVTCVRPLPDETWQVEVTDLATNKSSQHIFDAVMVCNGRYSVSVSPELPGADVFKGKTVHCHDYRDCKDFSGQSVLIIGAGPSAMDLTVELLTCAKQVTLSHHSTHVGADMFPPSLLQMPDVERLTPHGAIFKNGKSVELDVIVFCTGYDFSFPFLHPSCGINVTERGVEPLYRHLINIERPTMCFMVITSHVVPFRLADLQARYFLSVFEGRVQLPSVDEMRRHTALDQERRRADGLIGAQVAHLMGPRQKDYYDALAHEANIQTIPPVISAVHAECIRCILNDVFTYRNLKFKINDSSEYEKIKL